MIWRGEARCSPAIKLRRRLIQEHIPQISQTIRTCRACPLHGGALALPANLIGGTVNSPTRRVGLLFRHARERQLNMLLPAGTDDTTQPFTPGFFLCQENRRSYIQPGPREHGSRLFGSEASQPATTQSAIDL